MAAATDVEHDTAADRLENYDDSAGIHDEESPLLESSTTDEATVTPTNAGSRWVTVEPVTVLFGFGWAAVTGIMQPEYIQLRTAEDLNYNLSEDLTGCEANSNDPEYMLRQKVADQTAYWLMIAGTVMWFPALIVAPFYGSLSDRMGRKVHLLVPIVFYTLQLVLQLMAMYKDLPLSFYSSFAIVTGFGGGFCFFFTGSCAYIADVSSVKSRVVRMSVNVAVNYTIIGSTPVFCGYIIDNYGKDAYIPLMWLAIVAEVLAMLYICLWLPETNKSRYSLDNFKLSVFTDALGDMFRLFKENAHKRRTRLSLLIFIYFLTDFVQLSTGAGGVFIIYGLGPPFCWPATIVGYFGMVSYVSGTLGMLIGGQLFSCLQDFWILEIAYLSAVILYVMAALAPNTVVFFLTPVIGAFRAMDSPVIYTLLSTLVTTEERGVVFAVTSSVQSLANLLTPLLWNSIYRATLHTNPSFVFYAMGSFFVVLMIMSWVWFYISSKVSVPMTKGTKFTTKPPTSTHIKHRD